MRYVDGYVLPVKRSKLNVYRKMAKDASAIWMKHGALQYVEAVSDDLDTVRTWGGMPFQHAAKAKRGEAVVFAFIVFTSRAHRDRVNAKVMREMNEWMAKEKKKGRVKAMPFDMKRMAYAGFKTIVDL